MAGLALLAVLRKDVAAAQQQYGNLRQGGTTVIGLIAVGLIVRDRLLGMLAETMGDLDQGRPAFR